MKPKPKNEISGAVRNPDRTRRRILDAAFNEFSLRGLAGARVDVIARRARINKRMLYHYFGDKQGLYTAVVLAKIASRKNSVAAMQPPDLDVVSNIGLWFRQNCLDLDWIKLLAWESLQTTGDRVLDESRRRQITALAVARVKARQAAGLIRRDLRPEHLHLVKISLTMFPMVMPQITRLILGYSPHSPRFQRDYRRVLESIAEIFRPVQPAKKPGATRRRRG